MTNIQAPPKVTIAVLICTNVIGGHEFQASALVRDLGKYADVTVYVNDDKHVPMFAASGAQTVSLSNQLLRPGTLPKQVLHGLRARSELLKQLGTPDQVLICAGAVEAGVAASIALYRQVPLSLYLPSFYDRVPLWGKVGCLYNRILSSFCALYGRIVTINRIQAKVIASFTGIQTVVVPNAVREVVRAGTDRPGRLVFIGRLDRQKRIDELLLWSDFSGNPFSEFLVIGDGPERAQLELIAKRVEHLNVTFRGWLAAEQQDALLDRNDILLINSVIEGEPLVIREAQKRGMRVVARNIVGVRGVTTRSSRFNSDEGLRAILRGLPQSQPAEIARPDTDENSRRERGVLKFLAELIPEVTV